MDLSKKSYECYSTGSGAAEEALLQLDRAVDVINDAGPGGTGELLLVAHEGLEAELAVGALEHEVEVDGVVAEPGVEVVGLEVLLERVQRVGVEARAVGGVEHLAEELALPAELLVGVIQEVFVAGVVAEALLEVRARLVHKKNWSAPGGGFESQIQSDPRPRDTSRTLAGVVLVFVEDKVEVQLRH